MSRTAFLPEFQVAVVNVADGKVITGSQNVNTMGELALKDRQEKIVGLNSSNSIHFQGAD